MTAKLDRREFLKLGALAAGTAAGAMAGTAGAQEGVNRRPGLHQGRRVEEIPSICEMCFWRCGIVGKVHAGELLRVEGNLAHPLTGGRLCARGIAGHRLLYDPDRLKYPLLRVGARGEGRWQRISWDEAFSIAAQRLDAIKQAWGPSAVAYFPHGLSAKLFGQVMSSFGSKTMSSASFFHCRGPRDVGYELTFGYDPGSPERVDFENARLIVLIGTHIGENVHTSAIKEFVEGIARGAKLVVVDPRFSVAASKADWWLPIKPGTDTALLLAWISRILAREGHDAEYLARHATGLEELRQATSSYSTGWAAGITGLDRKAIEEIADLMVASRPAVVIHPGRQVTWYGNDTQRSRAMAILTAILGTWGRPGGAYLPTGVKLARCPCIEDEAGEPEEPCPIDKYPLKAEGIPSTCIRDATLSQEYPIKAWITYGQNILHSIPDKPRTIEALKSLDFVMHVDIMPTEPALWADLVLPEATYLERYDLPLEVSSAKTPFVALRQPVVEPMYESKDPFEIAKGLASALGLEGCLPCPDMHGAVRYMYEKAGQDFGAALRTGITMFEGNPFPPDDDMKFFTASGKIELWSQTLVDLGFDGVPGWEPTADPPAGSLRLVNGRSPYHTFTRTMNNDWLLEQCPDNPIWLNDAAGRAMGLVTGDLVHLENQDGVRRGPLGVILTPGIRPDIVYMVHGFGQRSHALSRANGRGVSDNDLMTHAVHDPIVGTTGIRVNFVRLVKDGEVLSAPSIEVEGAVLRKSQRRFVAPATSGTRDRRPSSPAKTPAAPPPAGGASGKSEGC